MRRNFAQILKNGKVDLNHEYEKLHRLFFEDKLVSPCTVYEVIADNFGNLPFTFRGTDLTIYDFNKSHGFNFRSMSFLDDVSADDLISFCEYVINLTMRTQDEDLYFVKPIILQQIDGIINTIGYTNSKEDGFIIFVPKDSVALSVAELPIIPDSLSYKVIAYNHHSMKGDIDSKRELIVKLADILEPNRSKLKKENSELEDNLFFAFNNCNIRHNNITQGDKNYREYIAKLNKSDLEKLYDEIYQMCLLAFMTIDNIDRKSYIKQVKEDINR